MTIAELTQAVQFTVDQQGRVTAVVIEPTLWERIVAALEDAEEGRWSSHCAIGWHRAPKLPAHCAGQT